MRPYHAYTPDQAFLFPPSLLEAINPDDPVHVVRQAVHALDLSTIHDAYRADRGRPPFHPEAMVGPLLYGACRGVYSSRKLAQACCAQITFMSLTGCARPDSLPTTHSRAPPSPRSRWDGICWAAGVTPPKRSSFKLLVKQRSMGPG